MEMVFADGFLDNDMSTAVKAKLRFESCQYIVAKIVKAFLTQITMTSSDWMILAPP